MSVKKGFTLAEVMITLTILGVLSAILIPAVMNIAPNKNKVLFKKAYSTLEKAISNMINDDVNYPSDAVTGGIQRGFNYTTATTNGSVNKFCYFLTESMNTIGSVNCPTTTGFGYHKNFATTSDGISWSIDLGGGDGAPNSQFPISSTLYATSIIIDVNGSKSPNCTDDTNASGTDYPAKCSSLIDTPKPDSFVIGVRYDGKLQVGVTSTSDATAISILSNPMDNQ